MALTLGPADLSPIGNQGAFLGLGFLTLQRKQKGLGFIVRAYVGRKENLNQSTLFVQS